MTSRGRVARLPGWEELPTFLEVFPSRGCFCRQGDWVRLDELTALRQICISIDLTTFRNFSYEGDLVLVCVLAVRSHLLTAAKNYIKCERLVPT